MRRLLKKTLKVDRRKRKNLKNSLKSPIKLTRRFYKAYD